MLRPYWVARAIRYPAVRPRARLWFVLAVTVTCFRVFVVAALVVRVLFALILFALILFALIMTARCT